VPRHTQSGPGAHQVEDNAFPGNAASQTLVSVGQLDQTLGNDETACMFSWGLKLRVPAWQSWSRQAGEWQAARRWAPLDRDCCRMR
jgi:hypothetical protein